MTLSLLDVKDNFNSKKSEFRDEYDQIIIQAAKNCNEKDIQILIDMLRGDEDWQDSVLNALSNQCAKTLNPAQLEEVGGLLKSQDSGIRLKAVGVLDKSDRWPSAALLDAVVVEQQKGVQESMLASILGLAGVPDRQSVRLAMDTVASGVPITERLVDGLIAEHAGRA